MATPDSAARSSTEASKKPPLVVTERDIVFNCPHCRGELVVDQEGAGLEVPCSHCGQLLIVPPPRPAAAALIPSPAPPTPTASAAVPTNPAPRSLPEVAAPALPVVPPPAQATVPARTFEHDGMSPEQLAKRQGELKHQLKENRSQDTEMRGHVNRATIELHRLQMRLKKLQDRQADIEAELQSLQTQLGSGAV